MPLPVSRPEVKIASGWSDSEDDTSAKPKRSVKKIKARPKPKITAPMEMVRKEQILLESGLRSPFEEKAELLF